LHYGSSLRFDLDTATTKQVTEAIGAHANRGGWITFTDKSGQTWSILITQGIPIWLAPDPQSIPVDTVGTIGTQPEPLPDA
jgi:hypothetical protein